MMSYGLKISAKVVVAPLSDNKLLPAAAASQCADGVFFSQTAAQTQIGINKVCNNS
jgi:hypothetical protein